MITEAEATTALGIDPGPGRLTLPNTCFYGVLGTESEPTKGVLSVQIQTDRALFDALLPDPKTKALPGFRIVSGVGDAAFSWNEGHQGAISLAKGRAALTIVVQTPPTPLDDRVLATLGTIAAGRL